MLGLLVRRGKPDQRGQPVLPAQLGLLVPLVLIQWFRAQLVRRVQLVHRVFKV